MIVKQEGMIDFDGEGMPDDQGGGADRWVLIRQPETGAGEDRLAGGVVRIPAPYGCTRKSRRVISSRLIVM